jgi:hypothetical protein
MLCDYRNVIQFRTKSRRNLLTPVLLLFRRFPPIRKSIMRTGLGIYTEHRLAFRGYAAIRRVIDYPFR